MRDDLEHDPGDDPGWPWSWRTLAVFLPGAGLRAAGRPGGDSLQTLRSIFLGFCAMVVVIGVVVLILGDVNPEQTDRPEVSVPLVVAGCLVALVLQRLVPRPLDVSDAATLATSYRTRFFLRLAFAESCALLAFVAFVALGPAWVYAIGLAGALVGFRHAAPSRANLRADQDALGLRGCTSSLVASLRSH